MNRKTAILMVHLSAFFMVFIFGLQALAQSVPDGELEIAINATIDAFKVGQLGVIIMALIQLLKTRVVSGALLLIAAKFGLEQPKPAEIPADQVGYQELDLGKEPEELPKPKLPGGVVTGATVLLGAAGGVAQAMGSGTPLKQAVFQGLLSSGVATALYEMVAKPLIKKLSTKSTKKK